MMFELTARELIAEIFLAGGAFFLLASAIGMLRLPDFYCRLHASGNSETLGIMLSFIGLMIYEGMTIVSVKPGSPVIGIPYNYYCLRYFLQGYPVRGCHLQ